MSDGTQGMPDGAGAREESAELIRAHGPQLARQAVELRGMDPEARPVGLILTAGTREAAQLRAALGDALGHAGDGKGLATLVPRHVALTILRQAAPRALDWLAADEAEDGQRTLPLLVATPEGFRLGRVAYP